MMHGFGVTGDFEEAYMQLALVAKANGFLYAYGERHGGPQDRPTILERHGRLLRQRRTFRSTTSRTSMRFAEDVSQKYSVDPKRFYPRRAFERWIHGPSGTPAITPNKSPRWSASPEPSGKTPSLCKPSEPVTVAEVHGDDDTVILYDGGANYDITGDAHAYPSAPQTVATWAAKDTCAQGLEDGGALSLDTALDAGNTQIERYGSCAAQTNVELWTIHGGSHIPPLDATWGQSVWAFLSAHPKR